ncbi:hypothetical protein ACQKGC_08420 [Allorhizobium pseudoryzae]|uniref:hypothetical protein n=1 Tax=Allorhizobium pseudoryzae TaxID=379684 RepID=UPI0013E9BFB7|nr:hypothetical protein [Allorhizobium pseudoryzae]
MQNFELIVIAGQGVVSDEVRQAWGAAGVLLTGPVEPDSVNFEAVRRTGGVLMDLSLDSATLFTLSEKMMTLKVPFLFIVTHNEAPGAVHPFVLSKEREDREAILDALAREADEYHSNILH